MEKRFFEEVEIPNVQKSENGILFPTVLSPYSNALSLHALTEAIKSRKAWLESLLHKSGAVLLRGFPVTSASDFNRVVEAFDYPEMVDTGGGANRSYVTGRVFTANESPPENKIHFHNEKAYASDFPKKLFFFCEVEPGKGGETAIVSSQVVYDKMKERHPEFVTELKKQGLIYHRQIPESDNLWSLIDGGCKSTFSTNDKSIAEQRAAELGVKIKLMGNSVYIVTDAVPAIRFDEGRQRNVWFNSLALNYRTPENINGLDKFVTFGNGDELPQHAVLDCLKIMDEEAVAIPWRKGDVLLVDNMALLHARLPLISPPRRILVSLCR